LHPLPTRLYPLPTRLRPSLLVCTPSHSFATFPTRLRPFPLVCTAPCSFAPPSRSFSLHCCFLCAQPLAPENKSCNRSRGAIPLDAMNRRRSGGPSRTSLRSMTAVCQHLYTAKDVYAFAVVVFVFEDVSIPSMCGLYAKSHRKDPNSLAECQKTMLCPIMTSQLRECSLHRIMSLT